MPLGEGRLLRVGWLNGVAVIAGNGLLRFDPQSQSADSTATSFISHAHGDHLRRISQLGKSYLTPETMDIGNTFHVLAGPNMRPLRLGESIKQDDVEVIAHNAGHMLGSAQFEIRTPDSTVVYTGDINCRDMFTTKAADNIPCDILVLETTYGVPFYVFPDLTQTSVEIVEWALSQIKVGKIPVFKAYSGGKAQEVVRIFNTLTKLPVITEGAATGITDAYTRNGVKLQHVDAEAPSADQLLKSGECVCVTSTSHGLLSHAKAAQAVATGWALGNRFRGVDAAFPLSGHADFQQLVEYVKRARPRELLTVHGFKAEFSSYIRRRLGVKASPIPLIRQKQLGEYL